MTSSEYNATLDKAAGANLQGAVFEIYDPFTYVVLATIETDSYGVAASTGPSVKSCVSDIRQSQV